MRKNQANQDQNMSYSDSGESPMINVNTNQNKVFEIETTESSPLNVKSEVESPKIQSPKTTQSGT